MFGNGFDYFKEVCNTEMQGFEELLANLFPEDLFYTILRIFFNTQMTHCCILSLAHVIRVLFLPLAPFWILNVDIILKMQ